MNTVTENVVEEVAATDAVATKPASTAKPKAKVSKTKAKAKPGSTPAQKAKAQAAKQRAKDKAEKLKEKAKQAAIDAAAKAKAVVASVKAVDKLVVSINKDMVKLRSVGVDMIRIAMDSGDHLVELQNEIADAQNLSFKTWVKEGSEAGSFPLSYSQVKKYQALAIKRDAVEAILSGDTVKQLTIDEVTTMIGDGYDPDAQAEKQAEKAAKVEPKAEVDLDAGEGHIPSTIKAVIAQCEHVSELKAVIRACEARIASIEAIPATPAALAEDDADEDNTDVEDVAAAMEGKTAHSDFI